MSSCQSIKLIYSEGQKEYNNWMKAKTDSNENIDREGERDGEGERVRERWRGRWREIS